MPSLGEGWDGASCVLCFLHFSLGISLLAAGYLSVLILFSNLRSHQANGYIPCAITVANPQASCPRIEFMLERLIVTAFGHMSVFSWRTFVVFLTVGGDRSVGRIGVIGGHSTSLRFRQTCRRVPDRWVSCIPCDMTFFLPLPSYLYTPPPHWHCCCR